MPPYKYSEQAVLTEQLQHLTTDAEVGYIQAELSQMYDMMYFSSMTPTETEAYITGMAGREFYMMDNAAIPADQMVALARLAFINVATFNSDLERL